ncbi:MAG: glycoside hydrolase family 3 C-terminal domain-containing protein [Anaerolineae bacterium]
MDAILKVWYPGEEGGTAIAAALFGDINPGGKLPVTFYAATTDLPPFEDYRMPGRTYRFFKGQPLFPFGHGLSYTTFAFSELIVGRAQASAGETVPIAVTMRNTGNRTGDTVVQLYVRRDCAGGPRRELKGFERIRLEAGAEKRVKFDLPVNLLATYADGRTTVLQPGEVEVKVGASSEDLTLLGRFEISGPETPVERSFHVPVD